MGEFTQQYLPTALKLLRAIAGDEKLSLSTITSTTRPLYPQSNVIDFAAKPATHVDSSQVNQIRPIDLFPIDSSENEFAKVKFPGCDFWIVGSHDENVELTGEELVVVEKYVGEVAISTSGKQEAVEKKHLCELCSRQRRHRSADYTG